MQSFTVAVFPECTALLTVKTAAKGEDVMFRTQLCLRARAWLPAPCPELEWAFKQTNVLQADTLVNAF